MDETNLTLEERNEEEAFAEALLPEEDTPEEPGAGAGETGLERGAALPPMLRVKYNGKEREIPLEEATILAQKGMNYDHVATERDALRHSMSEMEELARHYGLKRDELLARFREGYAQEQARMGAPEQPGETTGEMGRMREELANLYREREERMRQEESLKPWNALIDAYPELGSLGAKLPEEVIQAIRRGAEPVVAYARYENQQLRGRLTAMEQNRRTRDKAVGSAAADATGAANDDFLDGFEEA